MADTSWERVPTRRKLGTKLALVIAVTVVVLDHVLLLWDPYGTWEMGGGDEAGSTRMDMDDMDMSMDMDMDMDMGGSWDEMDAMEPMRPMEPMPSMDEMAPMEPLDELGGALDPAAVAFTLVYALLQAAVIYFAVSWLITRRLERLSDQVVHSFEGDGRAARPFAVEGRDEVSLLARALNALRERVGEAMERLGRRDRARREWVAQVSHDLRTPLAALTASFDGAERACAELKDSESAAPILAHLDSGRQLSRRVGTIATDLLEVARLEAEEAPRREPVPVRELIRRTSETVEPLASERGVHIAQCVEPEVEMIHGDGHLLARALENLLSNSIHHARTRVRVSARALDGSTEVRVEDDGEGLGGADGSISFDALRERRSRPDSAGLGLLVVQRVAEAHGGRAGAEQASGGGASVWFTVA